MASAFEKLVGLLRALNREGVSYVLFGRQAVNLHGIPRFTQDVDLFVEPGAANVERLRRALKDVWNDPEIEKTRSKWPRHDTRQADGRSARGAVSASPRARFPTPIAKNASYVPTLGEDG